MMSSQVGDTGPSITVLLPSETERTKFVTRIRNKRFTHTLFLSPVLFFLPFTLRSLEDPSSSSSYTHTTRSLGHVPSPALIFQKTIRMDVETVPLLPPLVKENKQK